MNRLRHYSWPGNVRELRTAIEHGVVMSNVDVIGTEHLPYFLQTEESDPSVITTISGQDSQKEEKSLASEDEFNLHVLELHAIERALKQTKNNRTDAARLLGISRRTLQRKLKQQP